MIPVSQVAFEYKVIVITYEGIQQFHEKGNEK